MKLFTRDSTSTKPALGGPVHSQPTTSPAEDPSIEARLIARFGPDIGPKIAAELQGSGSGLIPNASPHLQKLREIGLRRAALEVQAQQVAQRYACEREPLEAKRGAALAALHQAESDWEACEVRKCFVKAQYDAAIASDAVDAVHRAESVALAEIVAQLNDLDFQARPNLGDPANWTVPAWHLPSEPAATRVPERETVWVSLVAQPLKP